MRTNTAEEALTKIEDFVSGQLAAGENPALLRYSLVLKGRRVRVGVSHYSVQGDTRKETEEASSARLNVGISAVEAARRDDFLQTAHECLQRHGFTPNPKLHGVTQPQLQKFISAALQQVHEIYTSDFPKGFSNATPKPASEPAALFTVIPEYSAKKTQSARIEVSLRPVSDVEAMKTQYVLNPVVFAFNCGTNDSAQVNRIVSWTEEVLRQHQCQEGGLKMSNVERGKSRIPLTWIDQNKIDPPFLLRSSNKNYRINVVKQDAATRVPYVMISTGTDDPAHAKAIHRALVTEFIPGRIKSQEEFSPDDIRSWLRDRFPKTATPAGRSANMHHMRRVGRTGGEEVLKISPPRIKPVYENRQLVSHAAQLLFFPASPLGAAKHGIKSFEPSVNTSWPPLAHIRADQLQETVALALKGWLDEHPCVEICTEPSKKEAEKPCFKTPAHGETAPDGMVFFDTLRENVIRPAAEEYNRMIAWRVERTPAKEGKIQLTLHAIRNSNQTLPTHFAGPHTVIAANPAAADAFEQTLHRAMLAQQFPDNVTSRARPVDRFTAASQGLVVRESLAEALTRHPGIDLMGNKRLAGLRRTTPDPEALANEVVNHGANTQNTGVPPR